MSNRRRTPTETLDVSPPGETLREMLEERSMSQADLARRMGRPLKTINEIINGKAAITSDTAVELEVVLGVSADFWTARESRYRNAVARSEQAARHAAAAEWAARFPGRQMVKYNWISDEKEPAARVKEMLSFFAVATEAQWQQTYSSLSVAYRTSTAFTADDFALTAWLRRGEIEASRLQLASFTEPLFREALDHIRRLTITTPKVFVPAMTEACAAAGVAVAFVPALPKSPVSGATRWLSADAALVQLSVRYKSDDHLWFTFFHEAAHVLLHKKRQVFLEFGGSDGTEEHEANAWARNFLLPEPAYRSFVHARQFTASAIRSFAAQVGVAPGIVVGRLQHDEHILYSSHNDLKQRFEWIAPASVTAS